MEQENAIDSGVSTSELTNVAGNHIADFIIEKFGSKCSVLVISGPGNNGGDDFVIAYNLFKAGCNVQFMFCGDEDDLLESVLLFYKKCTSFAQVYNEVEFDRLNPDIVVDAMFGIDCNRSIIDIYKDVIDWIDGGGNGKFIVVLVDIASGVDSNFGMVLESAVKTALKSLLLYRNWPALSK